MSAVLKKNGHNVSLIYYSGLFDDGYINIAGMGKLFYNEEKIIKKIINTDPDILCFSVFTDEYLWSCRIAEFVKKKIDPVIVFGGIHPTSVPEKVIKNEYVDVVCVGEGEDALLELCNNANNANIPNLWFKRDGAVIKNAPRPLIENLDDLPMPDKDLFYDKMPELKKGVDYTIITSRGCPYRCTYCCNHILQNMYKGITDKYYRKRSVNNVISELETAKIKYRPNSVMFFDDMFISSEDWVKEFSTQYKKKINLPFLCLGISDRYTENVVKLLKYAGCVQISMGIQTVNDVIKEKTLKRPDKLRSIIEATTLVKKYKIGLSVDHIFGIPGESEEDQAAAVNIYNKMKPNIINTYYIKYFPKTEITQTALEQGRITSKDVEEIGDGYGKSYFEGGNINLNIYGPYRFLFGLIPIFSAKAINRIVKYKLYKYVKPTSFFSVVLPRFVASFFYKDIRVKRFFLKYLCLYNYYN